MRLIFLGSGAFGLPTFQRLCQKHEVALVVSQPDHPAGRGRHLTPTPIAARAHEMGLPVIKPADVNAPEVVDRITAIKPDAAMVIAFGQKLSQPLVAALGNLVVNLHGSLLPKYRGAGPVQWAILQGESQTGLTVIGLAQKMDAGLIYGRCSTPIDPLETAGELHDRLALLGPDLVEQVLERHANGTLVGQVQDESQVTRAPKLKKEDGWVDFRAPAQEVRCRVHGLTPWPGVKVSWCKAGQTSGDRPAVQLSLLRVADEPQLQHNQPPGTVLARHRVACGQGGVRGAVRLLEVQLPGGKPMKIEDFVRGHRLEVGDRLQGSQG